MCSKTPSYNFLSFLKSSLPNFLMMYIAKSLPTCPQALPRPPWYCWTQPCCRIRYLGASGRLHPSKPLQTLQRAMLWQHCWHRGVFRRQPYVSTVPKQVSLQLLLWVLTCSYFWRRENGSWELTVILPVATTKSPSEKSEKWFGAWSKAFTVTLLRTTSSMN